MRKLLFILFISVFSSPTLIAQTALSVRRNSLQLGIGMTATNYRGDLTDKNFALNRFYPGINISLQGEGHSRLHGQFNIGVGNFSEQTGQKQYALQAPDSIRPNRFVATSLIYGDVRMKMKLLNHRRMQPYISAGGGFLFYSPKDRRNLGLLDQEQTRLAEESYQLITLQAPLSVGFMYKITPIFGLGIDYTYRFLATDYIDNIGKLGLKPGNDALQNLQLTLYLIPSPTPYSMQAKVPRIKLPKNEAVDTIFVNKELYDLIQEVKEDLPNQVDEPAQEDYFDMLNKGSEWQYEIEKGLKNKQDSIQFQEQIRPDDDEIGADDYGWLWQKMVEKAMRQKKYVTFTPAENETYLDIYIKYHVRPSVVRRLNVLGNSTEVPKNKPIKIPDTRQWADLFPDVEAILKALEEN